MNGLYTTKPFRVSPHLLFCQRLLGVRPFVGREHNEGYVNILSDLINKLEIEDRVVIISDYDASHIPLYYGMADVFVSPSDNIQETFGLSVIEAMASGLPVIVSDWDGYRDTVVDGVT